ncbi:MAG: hypothetical protein ACFCUW_15145 [Kiloniellaceae bacterium]
MDQREVAHLLGKMEATYEALPRDEALIAGIMRDTGASREMVVQRLQAIAEKELGALRDSTPTPGLSDAAAADPAVRKFREMLR